MEGRNDGQNVKPMSFMEKVKMYSELCFASGTLLDNFLLLYIKKNDAKLSENSRKLRDNAEKFIFYTSIFGKALALGLLMRRVSFIAGLPFNPINDIQTVLFAYGGILLADSLPITFYWEKLEPVVMDIAQDQDEYLDIYANNLMHPAKIFYYNNFM